MKIYVIALTVLATHCLKAQSFETETLLWNGDSDRRINMVILSDGYQESELDQFVIDAENFMDALFGQPPFDEYKSYFNVVAIKVPSNESGASHPGTAVDVDEPAHPVQIVDNYFGSTFDAFGIHRLLVPENTSAIYTVLANNFPEYDQAFVLVNSPYYGGSGGQIATASTGESSDEVAIHELGHSFSALKDEYYAGDVYASEGINMTQETNANEVRWTNWMDDNGIGIYQHCCGGASANWYRPHQECKMRYLGFPFCSVCTEGIVEEIHERVIPIDLFTPDNPDVIPVSTPVTFTADLLEPNPNTLRSSWLLNGNSIAQNITSVDIEATDLDDGINLLQFSVEDTSSYLRVDDHSEEHLYTVLWELDQSALGISSISQNMVAISIFPNPVGELLNIKVDDTNNSDFNLSIIDLSGREFYTDQYSYNSKGYEVDIQDFPSGLYIARITLSSGEVLSKQIVKI